MNTLREQTVRKQAYIRRTLKAGQPRVGLLAGMGQVIKEGSGMGKDIAAHVVALLGVGGLVLLAIGAITESPVYHAVINWIGSLFY